MKPMRTALQLVVSTIALFALYKLITTLFKWIVAGTLVIVLLNMIF